MYFGKNILTLLNFQTVMKNCQYFQRKRSSVAKFQRTLTKYLRLMIIKVNFIILFVDIANEKVVSLFTSVCMCMYFSEQL